MMANLNRYVRDAQNARNIEDKIAALIKAIEEIAKSIAALEREIGKK
jgi:hypothetical protein